MKQLNKLPFAPVVGVMFALVAAILVLATPQFLFERVVTGTGLPALVSAATPPLGEKARIITALLAAAAVGGIVWLMLAKLEQAALRRAPLSHGSRTTAAPVTAGLDRVHAVRPQPILAGSDLGAPFMSDEAMSLAREELLLDPVMVAPTLARPEPMGPRLVSPAPAQTVQGLLGHLEDALSRREQRVGRLAPVPGDIASLRAALGMSIAA